MRIVPLVTLAALALSACSVQRRSPEQAATMDPAADEHAGHAMEASGSGPLARASGALQGVGVPAGANDVAARLQSSSRHAEWVMIPAAAGSTDSIAAYVVYPERRDNAAVVVVIHEIFGLSTWVRGVADQLAADGFIAIAPDLLSKERGGASTDSLPFPEATAMIRRVTTDQTNAMVAAVAKYGMALPAARQVYGVVGYCWGGSASFNHAVFGPAGLKAAVVYYGSSPAAEEIAKVKIPVLGLYGENDQRVNATIGRADSTMKAIGGSFVSHIYAGARHGFLRQQDQEANAAASREAWPATIAFFRQHLR